MASAAPGKTQRSAAGTAGGAAAIRKTGSEEGQGPTPPCTPPDISLYGLIPSVHGLGGARKAPTARKAAPVWAAKVPGCWITSLKRPFLTKRPCLCGPHGKSGRDGGKSTFTEMKDVETEPRESQIPSEGYVKIKYFIP